MALGCTVVTAGFGSKGTEERFCYETSVFASCPTYCVLAPSLSQAAMIRTAKKRKDDIVNIHQVLKFIFKVGSKGCSFAIIFMLQIDSFE